MAKKTKTVEASAFFCAICLDELTDDNAIGGCTVCAKCQSRYYRRLEEANGTHLAIFLTAAAFNLPCEPLIVPIDFVHHKGNKWAKYIKLLEENNKMTDKNGENRGFLDGVNDIRSVFGKALTETDFARYIAAEQDRIATLPGTEEQRERWGEDDLCKGLPMTSDLYDKLDRKYEIWCARYKGQSFTPQLEDSIIEICKKNMASDYLFRIGDYANAQKVQKMVDEKMASEQMRKKDEKPVESLQVDAMVVAFENRGLMEKGKLVRHKDFAKTVAENFVKQPKYDHSIDVVDQMIYDYYNTMRQNADLPIETELPVSLKVEDEYGEFFDKPTAAEEENKKYAGLTSVVFKDGSTRQYKKSTNKKTANGR